MRRPPFGQNAAARTGVMKKSRIRMTETVAVSRSLLETEPTGLDLSLTSVGPFSRASRKLRAWLFYEAMTQ